VTKKRKKQLECLLDWEREGGLLPVTADLFNRKVSNTLYLREITPKLWEIEAVRAIVTEDGTRFDRTSVSVSHETLIQLGLSILDGISIAEKRGK